MADGLGWLKTVHILGAIAWMAGLFYLPRLMVYHARWKAGSEVSEQFKVMERRLLVAIMRPAMAVTWMFGLWLGVSAGWLEGGQWWLWLKMALAAGLLAVHVLLEKHSADFGKDLRTHGSGYYRVLNEVPTVLLVGIVILAVLKPF